MGHKARPENVNRETSAWDTKIHRASGENVLIWVDRFETYLFCAKLSIGQTLEEWIEQHHKGELVEVFERQPISAGRQNLESWRDRVKANQRKVTA